MQDYIWIDAICINQQNRLELNAQVNMMEEIYRKAQNVIIWLGPSDEHTTRGIEMMNRLSLVKPENLTFEIPDSLEDPKLYKILGIPYITSDGWQALATFLLRTWFSRLWVLQETFAARNIEVLLGAHVLSWAKITAVSQVLSQTRLGRLLIEKVEGHVSSRKSADERPEYIGNIINNIFMFDGLRRKKTDDTAWFNLENLLAYSRYFNAKEAQDHVFAVRGIWSCSGSHSADIKFIKPNYGSTVKETYTRASRVMMREMGDINLLSHVEDYTIRSLKALPSWVPDFSVTPVAEPLSGPIGSRRACEKNERWNASEGLEWEVPALLTNEKLYQLPVQGICFDIVIVTAATYSEITDEHELCTLLDLLKHSLESLSSSPDKTRTVEAFWKTIIKDTFLGSPTDEEARRAFPILITEWIQELESVSTESDGFAAKYSKAKTLITELSQIDKSCIIPTWESIQETIKKNDDGTLPEQIDHDAENISQSFRLAYLGRRLFQTQGNRFGIGSQSLKHGNEVWVLAGLSVPVLLKKGSSENKRFVVGEAYVHGAMNGEAVRGKDVVSIVLE
jgi:hypothetical protein